jgi:hypothetical protein
MRFMLFNHPLLFYMLDLFLADFVYAAELVEKEGR